ncbi:MAG: DUF3164 family protein, partial [Kiritimatiellae bacterium]|nr:DUF3164 family protein [Kiritimatiellia bacterium]
MTENAKEAAATPGKENGMTENAKEAAAAPGKEAGRPAAPEGYMEDAQGRLVPLAHVAELDKIRDELVRRLSAEAEELSGRLDAFRRRAAAEVRSLVELAAQEYGVRPRSDRGAVTLTSYDGLARVQLAADDKLEFTEAMGLARE